jgi:hypothetical protein
MGKVLYGVRRIDLTQLETSGAAMTTGAKTVKLLDPQQVSFDPQIIEGQKTELRGGDKLLATVQEPDILDSVTASLQAATLDYVAMYLMQGGTLKGTEGSYTGWDAPLMADSTNKPAFKAELYIARYQEGSQAQADVDGYIKITLWYCTGRIPSWSNADRGFAVPSYQIISRENGSQSKPCIAMEELTELPA